MKFSYKQTLKSLLKWFLKILIFYLFIILSKGFWLPWLSDFLIIEQTFKKVDLLVVSTGSYERFRFAIDLLNNQKSDNLLILGDRRITTPFPGKSPLDLAKDEALELGINSDLLWFKHSKSTWMDALNTLEIMKEKGISSCAIISDIYNMRRLAMIFDHVFNGSKIDIKYISAGGTWNPFHPDKWWEYPLEYEYVIKELMKLPINYYRILSENKI